HPSVPALSLAALLLYPLCVLPAGGRRRACPARPGPGPGTVLYHACRTSRAGCAGAGCAPAMVGRPAPAWTSGQLAANRAAPWHWTCRWAGAVEHDSAAPLCLRCSPGAQRDGVAALEDAAGVDALAPVPTAGGAGRCRRAAGAGPFPCRDPHLAW